MCVYTRPAHLYHLSDNLPDAQKKNKKRKEKLIFENHMWRKIIQASKETWMVIFKLSDQQMDNQRAVGIPR